jgi:hypothetical protein
VPPTVAPKARRSISFRATFSPQARMPTPGSRIDLCVCDRVERSLCAHHLFLSALVIGLQGVELLDVLTAGVPLAIDLREVAETSPRFLRRFLTQLCELVQGFLSLMGHGTFDLRIVRLFLPEACQLCSPRYRVDSGYSCSRQRLRGNKGNRGYYRMACRSRTAFTSSRSLLMCATANPCLFCSSVASVAIASV